jgi:hypothetical protein
MRTALVRLLALVALVLPLAARADPPRPYTSTALGFTASYPYPVKENLDPEGGGTAAGFDPQGIMYMVGVTPERPEVGKKKSVKEQLDDGLAGALERVHGKLASQKDVKLGSNPGREVEIELQGGHATFRAFVVGARVYLVGVVHKDGTAPPMTPADFFASFQLTKKR